MSTFRNARVVLAASGTMKCLADTPLVMRAAERGAPRDFIPYNLTFSSLYDAYAVPMVPVAFAVLYLRACKWRSLYVV